MAVAKTVRTGGSTHRQSISQRLVGKLGARRKLIYQAIWPRDKKVKGEEMQLCKLVKRTILTAFENCSTAASWLGNRGRSGGWKKGKEGKK